MFDIILIDVLLTFVHFVFLDMLVVVAVLYTVVCVANAQQTEWRPHGKWSDIHADNKFTVIDGQNHGSRPR